MHVPLETLDNILRKAVESVCPLSYTADTATLVSLCLVSSVFRSIAASLLYANITIKSASQLSDLLRTLQDPKGTPPPIISLALRDWKDIDDEVGYTESECVEIVALIEHTPHLRRLLFGVSLPHNYVNTISTSVGRFGILEELILCDAHAAFEWLNAPLDKLCRLAVFSDEVEQGWSDQNLLSAAPDRRPSLTHLVYGPVCEMDDADELCATLKRAKNLQRMVLLNPPEEDDGEREPDTVREPLDSAALREALQAGLPTDSTGVEIVVEEDMPEAGLSVEPWREWMMVRAQDGVLWDVQATTLYP